MLTGFARFILFHKQKNIPQTWEKKRISEFLSHLAVDGNVSASTQNLAMCAIVFCINRCWKGIWVNSMTSLWAKRPAKLPEVFTVDEVAG
jgi:hypothetical protein